MPENEKDNQQPVRQLAASAITASFNSPPDAELPLAILARKLKRIASDLHWAWSVSIIGVILLVIGVTAAAYLGNFTFGKVMAGNIAVSRNLSDQQLATVIHDNSSKYQFQVSAPGQTAQAYKLADAGIGIDASASVSETRQAVRNLNWHRFAWWHTTTVPLTVTRKHKQFDSFVKDHIAIANQAAKNASLSASSGAATVTDSSEGWTYSLPGGNQSLIEAAGHLKPLNVTLAKTTVQPTITQKDLAPAVQKVDKLLDHDVSFTLGSKTFTATKKDIGNWLDIEAVPAKKAVDVTVNSGKVQAWLDTATKNDVFPARSEITATDDSGAVTVLISGKNGQTITNKASAVKAVASQLQQPNPAIHADLAVSYQTYTTVNAADYDKWIVVDLTSKRMYAYEHTTLVHSFLVSAGAPATPTVTGTYKIYSKYATKDMRGRNADGSRYFQPHVRYVNFFYQDYAIHGNYWRPASVFGNVNTSHGCVGIPDAEAEWLYNWAPIGTTVITHN